MAEEAYERSLVLTGRLGLLAIEAMVLANLAQLRVRLGLHSSAMLLARDCLEWALASGSRPNALFAILVHAEAEYELTGNPRALSRIGVVSADPALGRVAAEIEDVIERLRHSHPEADIDQALDAGASVVFDDVVRAIIDEDHH